LPAPKRPLSARHAALLSGAMILSFVAAPASADDQALLDLPMIALQQLRPGIPIEKIVATALMPIRELDLDGNGLDAADFDTARTMVMAQGRATEVGRILLSDIDGDGAVTEAEIRQTLNYQYSRTDPDGTSGKTQDWVQRKLEEEMARDTDGDKVITLKEMLAPLAGRRTIWPYEEKRELLKLDQNGDGRLTVEELEAVVRLAFRQVDADGDGVLSRQEFSANQQAIAAAGVEMNAPTCPLPPPSAADRVTILGMTEGDAQPTVTVNGQDNLTTLVRIGVEPGKEPIYLVLTSQNGVVWAFEGAVERLSRVAVVPGRYFGTEAKKGWANAAVQGVAKDRVTFLPLDSCVHGSYYDPKSRNGQLMARAVARALGRAPSGTVGVYAAQAIAIPSGTVTQAHKDQDLIISGDSAVMGTSTGEIKVIHGGLTPLMQEEWLSKSGGVVKVDPENLIAPGRVETYEVVPGQDGLRQLVENGTLERTDLGYRLLKPLSRWPAGLSGAHAVTFILPKGMAMPAGSPGQSQVITEQ
jgi:Ca2+-binding EF-hand superfamily protein